MLVFDAPGQASISARLASWNEGGTSACFFVEIYPNCNGIQSTKVFFATQVIRKKIMSELSMLEENQEMQLQALAKTLASLREEKGFSQEALAAKAGVTLRTIQNAEAARAKDGTYRLIADSLGYELIKEYFLREKK